VELVARELLGAIVASRIGGTRVVARITESEAYLGYDDPASHAYRGRRHRGNLGLYSPPGYWYVYRSYGVHWCANLVCGPAGRGAAVLLRGLSIVEGVETARRRRGRVGDPDLANGPGKLCQVLGLDRAIDAVRMRNSLVVVRPGGQVPDAKVLVTPRVGIARAVDWPLRFVVSTRRP
jgi:DNA-3-methyladenine glycosylase